MGKDVREVPPILIVLRDSHERIVYSWEVAPPKRQLAPGESVSINEAVDIAKKFSTDDSGKFVNGILDKVRSELMRPSRGQAELPKP